MHDDALAFDPPLGLEQASAKHDAAVALEDRRADDDVGDAGLVFQGREDRASRAARPLAHQDEAGDLDPPACR